MESPVVLDKPPEYHGNNDRGFPFDEEEGSGAWSELAARHPDIAARLRQRPATWARKRRPSSQDATDDFGESFSGFDRFPFDDIPPEFREHFPSRWNRRFSDRDQPPPESAPPPQSRSPPAHHHTAATQTERDDEQEQEHTLPQYGLRNTVDLGQRSAADPSVDADERSPRSMSAPPDAPRTVHPNMSAPNHHPGAAPPPHHDQHPTVRHIPIFVEGRDEPVINRSVDHGTHFGETKPAYQPPPPAPPVDREQYFADDGPAFHHPANFTRAFGTPFNKGFRQGPQPFTQQKAYPQGAFARAASPQRSQSPRPHPPQEEHYVKVPVHHEPAPPRAEPPSRAQQKPPPPRQPSPPPSQQQREPTPPKPQQSPSDPITQILSIQTDVLNLMTEVENFKGTKKDKRYLFLDEMLTRNLIKLDNIETEGKENIRQARREAIRCIEKCIAVLEAKADSNSAKMAETQDVEMKENNESTAEPELVTENGEVEMKEAPKEENVAQPERTDEAQAPKEEVKEETKREETPKPQETTKPEDTPKAQETPKREETPKPQETPKSEETPKQQEKPEETVKPQEEQTQKPQTEVALENTESQIPSTDTRPEETKPEEKTDEQKKKVENKPKKKVVKKRDKSKEASKESNTEEAPKDNTNSNKTEAAEAGVNVEAMQVDDKGDKPMEVDGAASQ